MDIIQEIKKRARVLTDDNIKNPNAFDYVLIENAMLIGASIEREAENIEFTKESYCCNDEEAKEIWDKIKEKREGE